MYRNENSEMQRSMHLQAGARVLTTEGHHCASVPERRETALLELPSWVLVVGQDFHTSVASAPGPEAPGRFSLGLLQKQAEVETIPGGCVRACVYVEERQKYFSPGPSQVGQLIGKAAIRKACG